MPSTATSDLRCGVCGKECGLIYYASLEEHRRNLHHGSVILAVAWGPGWRALYFDLADDADFCSAECSLRYHEKKHGHRS